MKLGLMKRLDLSLKWATIPWHSKDNDAAYLMLHLDPMIASLLVRGTGVDIAWAQLKSRGDGSWDLDTKSSGEVPGHIELLNHAYGVQGGGGKGIEVHYRDSKFVQKIMFAAYDMLAAVEEADKALLPDEVAASAKRFKKTLKKARKGLERGDDPSEGMDPRGA